MATRGSRPVTAFSPMRNGAGGDAVQAAAARRRVDLPHPEEPITEIISPGSAVKVTPRRTSWVPPGTAKDWPMASKTRGTAALDTACRFAEDSDAPGVTALLSVIVTSIVPGVSTGGGETAIGCCDVVEPGLSVALDGLLSTLWAPRLNQPDGRV